jgi:predicted nucleic acid-binding protein
VTLVDTSVWIHHLRHGSERLKALLVEDMVMCHPFVIGELACGNLKNRDEILGLLSSLPQVPMADHREVLHLLESHRLSGKGIGWIDAHLIASALISGCGLWTLDRTLLQVSTSLNLSRP